MYVYESAYGFEVACSHRFPREMVSDAWHAPTFDSRIEAEEWIAEYKKQ